MRAVDRACLADVDVTILAGGLGTRISGVLGGTPKILAPVAGRPFLDHLLDWLAGYGARRVVLCLGHLAEAVAAHLERRAPGPLIIECSQEPEPQGTGGALRRARAMLRSEPVLVMNGDTWLDIDLGDFLAAVATARAEIGIACVEVEDAARYGRVAVIDGLVTAFVEKIATHPGPGLVNGGVYAFSQSALDRLASMDGSSLERDFLQRMPFPRMAAYRVSGSFVDIGTPESLAQADALLSAAGAR